MNRMGHRSTRAALIYLHARDNRDREIAVGLDRIVTEELNAPKGPRTPLTRAPMIARGHHCAW
jgi:hypothetical protein